MPKEPLKVIAGAPDRPLIIGDVEIQCYVLEDETRVLSQRGFLQAIGRSVSRPRRSGGDETPAFLVSKNLKPFISNDLLTASIPVVFQAPSRGPIGHGFRAEILPRVCKVYLSARRAGVLRPHQMHVAERAEILLYGLAEIGIIALVDEATGYQQIRAERALATILEKFIAKEEGAQRVPHSRGLGAEWLRRPKGMADGSSIPKAETTAAGRSRSERRRLCVLELRPSERHIRGTLLH